MVETMDQWRKRLSLLISASAVIKIVTLPPCEERDQREK